MDEREDELEADADAEADVIQMADAALDAWVGITMLLPGSIGHVAPTANEVDRLLRQNRFQVLGVQGVTVRQIYRMGYLARDREARRGLADAGA